MKRLVRASSVVVGLTIIGVGLSGCITINESSGPNGKMINPDMHHGSNHSMSITDKKSFAEAMIPHHQQAVDISEFALTNTSNSAVVAIAEKIIGEQAPEIEKMTPWLEGDSADYSMMMDGMLSREQLAELEAAKDDEFDVLYVQYMVQHHEGAIAMAADALGIDDPELSEFANDIIVNQSAEIEELMSLLNN
jgi:uncharacterized protein (DUF305 family)